MDKTYPSKVDWWLGLILLGIAACVPVCIVAGIMALGSDMGAAITLFVTAVLSGLLLWALVWPITYTLTNEGVRVRFGVIKQTIKYGDIVHVVPTRNPLSSPALSLDRLEIKFGDTWVLVSPKDKEEFMRDLASRDEGLVFSDGKVSRR